MDRLIVFSISLAAACFPSIPQTTDTTHAAVNPSHIARSEQEVRQALADLRLAIVKQDGPAIDRLLADTYLAVRVDGTFQ